MRYSVTQQLGAVESLRPSLGYELAERGHDITFVSTQTPFRLIEAHAHIRFEEVKAVDFPLFSHPDSTLPLINHLLNRTKTQSFDIIHAHYAIPNAAAAVIAKALSPESSFKIVTTLHGTDVVKLGRNPEYSDLIEKALLGSDVVTCVSDNLKQLTLQSFPRIKNPRTIPNYYRKRNVEKDRESMRKELGLGDEKLVIHLSNLRKVKRIDLLLETFAKARKQQAMKLLILGGADFSEYQETVDDLGLTEDVLFCRDVVHVQDYIEASDVGLFCSEYESFCLGVLECMAHRLPVIAFDVGGIPEVLEHGKNGYLRPFDDTDALSSDLVRIIQDDALRLSLASQAQEHAMHCFSPQRAVDLYEELYLQLV